MVQERERRPSRDGVVTFGELLLRLAPVRPLRLEQASSFEVSYGGAEANVAVGLACLGIRSRFVSRLPENPLGAAGRRHLRGFGVDTRWVLNGGQRLGLYFVEPGAAQRPSQVLYDRAASSLATIEPGMVPWAAALEGWQWFHTSGITPAISESAYATTIEGLAAARRLSLRTSVDLNFRAKLWDWGRSARTVMTEVIALADVVFCNELDLQTIFAIPTPDADEAGIDPRSYEPACRELQRRFPNVTMVAMTLRTALSASHNRWTAIVVDGEAAYTARRYDVNPVIDRVGAGDAFAAAAISRMLGGADHQEMVDFAAAASCLKHSIAGDFNVISVDEVRRLVAGDGSGRIVR